MSILIDKNTRVVVQGITGRDGSFHTQQMVEYGTNVVAGVTPGKGGQTIDGIPVYNTIGDAIDKHNANASIIFVPARFAIDAIYEAADAGAKVIVAISEGVPVLDMIKAVDYVKDNGATLIGPNCPGIISPNKCKMGIMSGDIFNEGSIGVISRSGTLTYEIVDAVTKVGLGQSTCIGIGGDPIIGTKFIDALELFNDDPQTKGVALVGEIGGNDEEITADWITANFNKPVAAFIAGKTAPPGKRMGHAGAIVSGGSGTAESKIKKLEENGIPVAEVPAQVAELLKDML